MFIIRYINIMQIIVASLFIITGFVLNINLLIIIGALFIIVNVYEFKNPYKYKKRNGKKILEYSMPRKILHLIIGIGIIFDSIKYGVIYFAIPGIIITILALYDIKHGITLSKK